jgi:hypothetical protein
MATIEQDNLFAGSFPVETETAVLLSGQNVTRGTVLGKVTASGKLVIVNSAGTDDGRRAPYAIAAESVDATSGDKNILVYLSGTFNQSSMTFGGSDTIATHKDALRNLSIFTRKQNGQ